MGSPRGNLLQKVIPAKKDHTFCVRINWEHLPSCELVIQIHTVWVIKKKLSQEHRLKWFLVGFMPWYLAEANIDSV